MADPHVITALCEAPRRIFHSLSSPVANLPRRLGLESWSAGAGCCDPLGWNRPLPPADPRWHIKTDRRARL